MNGVQVEAIIKLDKVIKTYQGDAGNITALAGINLEVKSGEFVAVFGKSGSGKSTLLNTIAGIDRPTQGEVFVNNQAVHQLSESKTAVFRGINIGVVFQFFQLLPTLTILENILLPMDFCSIIKKPRRKARAMELLGRVDIADQAYKLPATLSGGQQQRAAIARALANNPPIIIADEPTGNLDSQTSGAVYNLFKSLADEGRTLLVVSHDREISSIADRTIKIADGKIVQDKGSEQPTREGVMR